MIKDYIEHKEFNTIDFRQNPIEFREFENCRFEQCDFSNTDLSGLIFRDCAFNNCNLSLVSLKSSLLQDIQFSGCKLLGIRFHECKPILFKVYFSHCMLNLSSFYQLKMKNTLFQHCVLEESDLSECDLSAAVFEECNLHKTIFDRTILTGADFRSAYNYSIDPENNFINKSKFSWQGIIGLLEKYNITIDA